MTQQTTATGPATGAQPLPPAVPAVVLVGLNGFGRQHLLNIERLVTEEKITFLAGVDPRDPGAEVRGESTRIFSSWDDFEASGLLPDIVIISTPINTHAPLALRALETGADLYLEKPPTATLAQYEELLEAAELRGAHVQVGFQALGSQAMAAIEGFFADDAAASPIGKLRAVGASGMWLRTTGYYDRAPWAGHRVLNGVDVADGVITNPLAHAVASALRIAGARSAEDVAELSTELYHAHRIEADDTSVVRLRTAAGIPVTAALTVCAAEQQDPWITIYGTEGSALLYYTRDELVIRPNPELGGTESRQNFGRVNLLENLVDVRRGACAELLSSLKSAGAFMRVLEQVRTAPEPAQIPAEAVIPAGAGTQFHPVIPHIEGFINRAVAAQSGFSSLAAPWAEPAPRSGQLCLPDAGNGSRAVAVLRTGQDIAVTNSPRPFLDSLRTLKGVVLSDQQPLDHTWHLGVGVALQDVNGTNFWGGRTYTRDAARYVWRRDHGRIRTVSNEFSADSSAVISLLEWVDRHGAVILDEQRTVRTEAFADEATGRDGWILDFEFSLTARSEPVYLGSPGSNGRDRGGYGGFFWRMPQVGNAHIYTHQARGEDQAHGSVSDWLAFSADFSAHSVGLPELASGHGEATLLFCSQDADPWFVRCAGYPGIGSSLAWDAAVLTEPGRPVSRRVRVLVLDGILAETDSKILAEAYGRTREGGH